VPEDLPFGGQPVGEVRIGAADGARRYLNQHLPRPWIGNRVLTYLELPGGLEVS
jgi:hypothetical protein